MNRRIKNKRKKQEIEQIVKKCYSGKSMVILNGAETIIEMTSPEFTVIPRDYSSAELCVRALLVSIATPNGLSPHLNCV